MPTIPIDDLDDPRIAVYRQLKATNQTRRSGLFVVEGEKLLERLVDSPHAVVSALAVERHAERIAGKLPAGVPLYVVAAGLVDVLVGFNFHQGVLGCGRPHDWAGWARRIEPGRPSTLVACPQLNNPENLGAILRIAEAFGVDAVLLGPRCPDPFSRRVLRVSMGSALRLPVVVVDDLAAELTRLRSDLGFTAIATVLDPAAEPLNRATPADRQVILLGSEPHGLGPEWLAQSDRLVTIPMRGGAESLNVAIAAGIVLHHFTAGIGLR